MSAGDEIMTPVSRPEAVAMAEIHALRQISDALTATNQSLHALTADVREVRADVKEVRDKVIRMEGEDLKAQLRDLKSDVKAAVGRVDLLEQTRDRAAGVLGASAWMSKYAPWLFAIIMAAAAGFGLQSGVGK